MNLFYLSTWATVLRAAATEAITPIVSFDDPAQALSYLRYQNDGDDIRAVTNDGVIYWLVSAALAIKLYEAGFYPMLSSNEVQEAVFQR